MDDNTKELTLNTAITDENGHGEDTIPDCYNPYFGTPLSTILDTSITAQKFWYHLINMSKDITSIDKYTIFSSSKSLRTWLGIQ